MTLDEVLTEVDRLDKESKELKSELLKICWYMRGGVTFGESFELTIEDRMLINDIIASNLETTKKTGMPFF